MKQNLADLCEVNNIHQSKVKWTGKYTAQVFDLCQIELVQIDKVSYPVLASSTAGSMTQSSTATTGESKLNMYMLILNRLNKTVPDPLREPSKEDEEVSADLKKLCLIDSI